mgnify:CR=1 FL=1
MYVIKLGKFCIFRERLNYKETCRALENQVTDLHAMLVGMEQAAEDAELRHAESIELVQKVPNIYYSRIWKILVLWLLCYTSHFS